MCVCVCADHYMQVLSCKQRCSVELASTVGLPKPFDDFLPAHFNYLQFSYYNSDYTHAHARTHIHTHIHTHTHTHTQYDGQSLMINSSTSA